MTKKFQRKIEDFQCENCGRKVQGNGYTNHCPKCLWSKHVDENPGDRKNPCQGLMAPIDAFLREGKWCLVQQCQKCAQKKIIKTTPDDNQEGIIAIIKKKLNA